MTESASPSRNEQFRSVWNAVQLSWIPANPAFLERLKAEIDRGVYDDSPGTLVDEIKTDLSLFTACLRELQEVSRTNGDQCEPIEMLRQAGVERLKAAMTEVSEKVPHARFHEMSEAQAARLQEAMISASVAERLADAAGLGAGLGYSTGIMRQFGLTLVSWNYPHVYERAVIKARSLEELESALAHTLGFKPSLLGVVMARQWCLPSAQRCALGDPLSTNGLSPEEEQQVRAVASELEAICSVGEALARANNPAAYPSAREDWNSARREIERRLGRMGMEQIKKSMLANCRQYMRSSAHSFLQAAIEKIDRRPEVVSGKVLFTQNRFIRACTPQAQRLLNEWYSSLDPHVISKDSIRLLTSKIIPVAGFQSGCVFVYDPSSQTLVPRTPIGGNSLSTYKTVDCSPIAEERTLVARAFDAVEVLVSDDAWENCEGTAFAGAYGRIQRAGVLLLTTRLPQRDSKMVFAALNQALIDCLKLK